MSIHLVLFFTRGVSLRTWSMMGMLDREVALYSFLMDQGLRVSFVTYGDATDLEYSDQLAGIRILCNEQGLPLERYENLLLSLHGDVLRTADIIKTNQTYGGELALWTARLLHKPLIARCGYMWSYNATREHGENSATASEARRVEAKVFGAADRVVVTTSTMREDILRRLPDARGRVFIIPNYVDTALFQPIKQTTDGRTLLFIGRIAPEKNLEALLEAIRPLQVKLTIIGEGKLRSHLQKKFAELDGRVVWEGSVPNSLLPQFLNRADIFVLPSLYEGHPKTVLEAMSCQVPVLGADSPGIRELIRHGQTGFLCGTDSRSIRIAVEEMLGHPTLRTELGVNARRYVIENYSLSEIGPVELSMLHEVASLQRRCGST